MSYRSFIIVQGSRLNNLYWIYALLSRNQPCRPWPQAQGSWRGLSAARDCFPPPGGRVLGWLAPMCGEGGEEFRWNAPECPFECVCGGGGGGCKSYLGFSEWQFELGFLNIPLQNQNPNEHSRTIQNTNERFMGIQNTNERFMSFQNTNWGYQNTNEQSRSIQNTNERIKSFQNTNRGYQNTNLKFIIPTRKSAILKMFKIPTDPFKIPTDPFKIPTDLFKIPTDPFKIPTDPFKIPTDPFKIPI